MDGPSRAWWFRLAALGLGLLLVAGLEGLARWWAPADDDPFVDLSRFTLFRALEVDGEPHLQITHPFAYPERATRFPRAKPAGGFRLFVVGASAAAGWPHPPEETFTAYLRSVLASGHDGPVEVINAAAHGFPSYRVRKVFDEVVELEPDAILVYTGNNEFLEGRRYRGGLERSRSLVERLRLAQLLRDRLLARQTRLAGDELNELAASMWRKVQRQALELRSDPEQRAGVERHFAASLTAMADRAAPLGVPVLWTTVPSNLRDWLPTVSAPPGPAAAGFSELLQRGRTELETGDLRAASRTLEEALSVHPSHAEAWFWLGRAREGTGDRDGARLAYRRARDEDLNPFRALSSFNDSVRQLATERGAPLLDLERQFDESTLGPAPGFDYFLDYVHPNRAGNRIIASAAYERLEAAGIYRPTRPVRPPPPSAYREEDDYALQMKIFGMALMNHQYAAAAARGHQVVELVRRRPAGPPSPIPAEPRAVVVEALGVLPRWLEVERRELQGQRPPAGEVEAARTAVDDFYRRWFEYGRF